MTQILQKLAGTLTALIMTLFTTLHLTTSVAWAQTSPFRSVEFIPPSEYLGLATGWENLYVWTSKRVQSLGLNTEGQLGIGNNTPSTSLVQVLGLNQKKIQQVSAGNAHACALTDDGVYCWGKNSEGRLGNGTYLDQNSPSRVQSLDSKKILQISAGYFHTCASTEDSVYCWGKYSEGQLKQSLPTLVTLPSRKIIQISAGVEHTCALTDDGVYCWGYNAFGQIFGNGTQAFGYSPAIRVTRLDSIKILQISSGGHYSCALAAQGVYCWGYNGAGQLGNGGKKDQTFPVQVKGLNSKEILQLSSGNSHTCAIASDGLYCWGYNADGQLGISGTHNKHSPHRALGLEGKKIIQISAGVLNTAVLTEDGLYISGAAYGLPKSTTFNKIVTSAELTPPSTSKYSPQPKKLSKKAIDQIEEIISFINDPKSNSARARLLELGATHNLSVSAKELVQFETFLGLGGSRKDIDYRIFPQMHLLTHEIPSSPIQLFQSPSRSSPLMEIVHIGSIAHGWDIPAKSNLDIKSDSEKRVPLLLFRLPETEYKKDVLLGLVHPETVGMSVKSIVKKSKASLAEFPLLDRLNGLLGKNIQFNLNLISTHLTPETNLFSSLKGNLTPKSHLQPFGHKEKLFGFYLQNLELSQSKPEICHTYSLSYGDELSTLRNCETSKDLSGQYVFPIEDIYLTTQSHPHSTDSNIEHQVIVDLGGGRTLITSESILTAMIQHNRLVNDALFGLPQQGSTLKGQWTKWKERHFPN
ncbi:MAG: hypothetical protein ABIQ95_16800, partial [Bdellovibrionia bacterium]